MLISQADDLSSASTMHPPIFIHSLWRSGSTYLFQVFRRSSAGYWCYQEPINEEALLRVNDPEGLLTTNNELARILRHPELDRPYYKELFETHSSWSGIIEKSILYDEYFCDECSNSSVRYILALIKAAKGRTVIQECRTSNRIGAIKRAVGGLHLYLWRNPWDQWWSFKCAEYFDVVAQLVVNAPRYPLAINRLRQEIGFVEFHDQNIVDELKYFEMRRLTADDSYLVFFVLWCLAWLEATQHADLCLNIDQITHSDEYRNSILLKLESLGVSDIDLTDCKMHCAVFVAQDREFFQRNEDRAFGVLLSAGIASSELEALRNARRDAAPKGQFSESENSDENSILTDAVRARGIVLRTETASVSRIRYLLQEWGQSAKTEFEAKNQNLTIQKMLQDMENQAAAREKEFSEKLEIANHETDSVLLLAREREDEANKRLVSFVERMQALSLELQRDHERSVEDERTRSEKREQMLRQELDVSRALLADERRENVAREKALTIEFSKEFETFSRDAEKRNAALVDRMFTLSFELQQDKSRMVEAERSNAEKKENVLRQELDETRALLEQVRHENAVHEKLLAAKFSEKFDTANREGNERLENLTGHIQALSLELQQYKERSSKAEKDIAIERIQSADTIASLKALLVDAFGQVDTMANSWFWQLTRPFRWGDHEYFQSLENRHKSLLAFGELIDGKPRCHHSAIVLPEADQNPERSPGMVDCQKFSIMDVHFEGNVSMVKDVNELLDLHGAPFVSAAYNELLGRAPDPEGMRHYLARLAGGEGKPAILFQITQSEEARKLVDIGEMRELDDDDFIVLVYRKLLRREPDSEGKRHYLEQLRKGRRRKLVVSDIKKSPEANRRGLKLPGLEALCAEQRKASHWFWGRLLAYRPLAKQINRLGYDLGHGTQRLVALLQQTQVHQDAQSERIETQLKQLQVQLSQIKFAKNKDSSESISVFEPTQDLGSMPKILHRVYFENYSPFYDPFLHYLETWKRELPAYEVMKWGYQNVDTSINEWMNKSADANDPVFLSEFVRWDVLKKYGGIYLDSDCEVLNGKIFDSLVEEMMNSTEYDAFVGVEEFYNGHPTAQTVAAKKGAALVEFMHEMYSGALSGPLWHWRAERGLIGPQLMSLYFREHGLSETKGFPIQLKAPIIVGRVKIYPQEYFSPKFTTTGKKLAVSENTCIYHLFANLNVKDVDPEAEKHRRSPLLFNDYCEYLARLSTGASGADAQANKLDSGLRKLHRIYFGFDGKPDPYKRYLDTWINQMPGYEICHWNATNLPLDNCQFSRMMHEFKDHAFLSDYFRWWILREHGGIYLDADVEITNGHLFDKLITELQDDQNIDAFIGIDSKADGWYTAHSMASKKGSKLARFMCEVYEGLGHASLWRRKVFYFMAPQLTSLYFANHGWNVDGMGSTPNLNTPVVVEGVKIYPQDWFSPMRPLMKDGVGGFEIDSYTGNTCICHHFSCSWHADDSPYKSKVNDEKKYYLLDELVR